MILQWSIGHITVCGMENHPIKSGFIYPLKIKGIEINPVYFKVCLLQFDSI